MKDFLKEFYRQVYTPVKKQYYMSERSENPEVDSFYQSLVESSQEVSLEDFWQRYEYRCGNLNRIALELWRADQRAQGLSPQRNHSRTTKEPRTPPLRLDHHRHGTVSPLLANPKRLVPTVSGGGTKTLQQLLEDARNHGQAVRAERQRTQSETNQGFQETMPPPTTIGTTTSDSVVVKTEPVVVVVGNTINNNNSKVLTWKQRLVNQQRSTPNKKTTTVPPENQDVVDKATTTSGESAAVEETQPPQDQNVPVTTVPSSEAENETPTSGTVQTWKNRLASKRRVRDSIFKKLDNVNVDESTHSSSQLAKALDVGDPSISLETGKENNDGVGAKTTVESSTLDSIQLVDQQVKSRGSTAVWAEHLLTIEHSKSQSGTLVARYETIDRGNHAPDIIEQAKQSRMGKQQFSGKIVVPKIDEDHKTPKRSPGDLVDIASIAKFSTHTINDGLEARTQSQKGFDSDAWIPSPHKGNTADQTFESVVQHSRCTVMELPARDVSTGLIDVDEASTRTLDSDGQVGSINMITSGSSSSESSEFLDAIVAYFRDEQSVKSHEGESIPIGGGELEASSWGPGLDDAPNYQDIEVMKESLEQAKFDSSAYLDDNTGSKDKCECQSSCSVM
jgi:hypothetical protein